jgi:hypothetical protein
MQEKIDEFLREINRLDYDFEALPISKPAFTFWERKVVIFNPALITPYYLKHEIIHIRRKHRNRLTAFNGNDERNPHERDAADESIHELLVDHLNEGGRFNYVDFMMCYGIPYFLETSVITEMSDLSLYANL